jgi:6,7-dimethyl-8-ribityllumazine synthase
MSVKEISGNLTADGLRLCVAVSRFNDFLTKQLLGGAIDCFVRHGGKAESITVVWVPGANELPMAIQKATKSGKYDAAVALGVVVEGSTKHADLINSQVSKTLGSVALSASMPVINGVVAADNLEQAIERCGTKAGNKGWSAVQAAIEMANVYKQLDK